MSESTSPPVAGGSDEYTAPALSAEGIETVLADFRTWLTALAAGGVDEPEPPPDDAVDLHMLVGQFTALRHDINLQTKAVRAQQEQNTETLRRLDETVESLAGSQGKSAPANDEVARAVLKGLIEVADVLTLARREVERLAQLARTALDLLRTSGPAPVPSRWAGWFGRPAASSPPNQQALDAAQRTQQLLDSIVTGYGMSVQRLERVLTQHGLEEIPCAGRPFDPERMEAIEAVTDSGQAAGTVLDVIRQGYFWKEKLFRYALVRVAK